MVTLEGQLVGNDARERGSVGVGGGGVEIRCHRQSSHKLQNSQVAIYSRSHLSTVSHEKSPIS